MADGARPAGPAQLRRVADDPGRLDLVGAPEGFDALIMADMVRARGGLSRVRRPRRRPALGLRRRLPVLRPGRRDPDVPGLGLPALRPGRARRPGFRPSGWRRCRAWPRAWTRKPRLLVTTVAAADAADAAASKPCKRAGYSAPGRQRPSRSPSWRRYFAVNGYMRASTVSEKGEFAVRGGVIDVFPPGFEEPVRLDMFGRHAGIDPHLRSRDPAIDGAAKTVSLAPVSARPCWTPTASRGSAPAIWTCSARRATIRSMPPISEGARRAGHGALAAAVLRPAGDAVRLSARRRRGRSWTTRSEAARASAGP